MSKLSYCLWFDGKAEEAANFYVSVFKTGKLGKITRYGKEGFEQHQQPEGKVMVAEFEIEGHKYMALNGGPYFKFNESFSIVVSCQTQEEVDYYWDKLISGGGSPSQCGWLKDKFGVSWQITPAILEKYMSDPDSKKTERVVKAYMPMTKLIIEDLKKAYEGK